jgi:hypothetical protein
MAEHLHIVANSLQTFSFPFFKPPKTLRAHFQEHQEHQEVSLSHNHESAARRQGERAA